jgi:hypothetical protein
MATCPNKSSQEWKNLVEELGGNEFLAFKAFQSNNDIIPAVDDPIVIKIRDFELDFGATNLTVEIDENGQEGDQYKGTNNEGKPIVFSRVTNMINFFSARKVDTTKSYGEKMAEKFWRNVSKDRKLRTDEGELESFDEYAIRKDKNLEQGKIKGTIIHKLIESLIKPGSAKKIRREIEVLAGSIGIDPNMYSWITQPDVYKKIFRNIGLNTFDELRPKDEFLRDKILSEQTIANEEMGVAGTIDLMAEHADRSYTLVDWKTGRSFNTEFKGALDVLLKYGNQATQEVKDTPKNRAKLQLAMYAVMIKANNPDAKFRNLIAAWIPNRYGASQLHKSQYVEVEAFIPIIEQFFKNKESLKEAGMNANIYKKMIAKSPNLFNVSHYSNNITRNIQEELMEANDPRSVTEKKIAELTQIVGAELKFTNLDPVKKKRALKLQKEIAELIKDPEMQLQEGAIEDIGVLTTWFGGYGDINNPYIQIWKKYRDQQVRRSELSHQVKLNKFQSLLKPVLNKYKKGRINIDKFGISDINYSELYGFMYKLEDREGEKHAIERLLTKEDSEYNTLTEDQKKLLDYTNEVFSEYFVGENAFLKQTATEKTLYGDTKLLSHLDLYNVDKSGDSKFNYYEGFFFKLPKTKEEIRFDAGKGSNIRGAFSRDVLEQKYQQGLTMFIENNYEQYQHAHQALPLKYLGNNEINYAQNYTKNMEFIFSQSIASLERKKNLDSVYAMGRATQSFLAMQESAEGEPLFENTVKFLDEKIMGDILGKRQIPKYARRSIKVPILTKDGFQRRPINIDKVIEGMMSWTSATIMWLKPLQGTGNGVHAALLTHRDGFKGSIAKSKFTGIKGDEIDFTEKEIAKADLEYFKLMGRDGIFGDIKKNKMWLLAKKFNYFGNNYDYATGEKVLLSMRNRTISQSSMYLFHSVPEEFVSMTTMGAQLMYMKNEITGKNLYDSYEVVEIEPGVYDVEWQGGIRGHVKKGQTIEELSELNSQEIAKLKRVHERMQGGYRQEERTNIENYVLGKAFIQLKKYLPRLIINAVHTKRKEVDLGAYRALMDEKGNPILKDGMTIYEWQARITEGRWITVANHIANIASIGRSATDYKWSNLSGEQKQNIIDAYLTLIMLTGSYAAYLALFQDIDDDDTSKKMWKMYLVDNLSQQYNPIDLLRTGKTAFTPVALAKSYDTAESIVTMLVAGSNYAVGNEDEAFTQKGDFRGFNNFQKAIPYVAAYKDFQTKVENDKAGWSDLLKLNKLR